jgi:hypothetical protein
MTLYRKMAKYRIIMKYRIIIGTGQPQEVAAAERCNICADV